MIWTLFAILVLMTGSFGAGMYILKVMKPSHILIWVCCMIAGATTLITGAVISDPSIALPSSYNSIAGMLYALLILHWISAQICGALFSDDESGEKKKKAQPSSRNYDRLDIEYEPLVIDANEFLRAVEKFFGGKQ